MNPSCVIFSCQIAFELPLPLIYVEKSGEFWVICLEWEVVPNVVAQPVSILCTLMIDDLHESYVIGWVAFTAHVRTIDWLV